MTRLLLPVFLLLALGALYVAAVEISFRMLGRRDDEPAYLDAAWGDC